MVASGTGQVSTSHENISAGNTPLSTLPAKLRCALLDHWPAIALVVIWALVQYALFLRLGIQLVPDSGRYTGGAEHFLRGEALPGKASSYWGYILFVSLFTASGLGVAGVVVGQVLLSGLATYGLVRLGDHLYDVKSGYIAALLYVAYPDVQRWNFFVLPESVFISITIISIFLILEYGERRKGLLALPIIALNAVVHPIGVIVPAAAIIYCVFRLWRRRKHHYALAVVLAALVVSPGVFDGIDTMLARETVAQHFVSGTVVWGYDGASISHDADFTRCINAYKTELTKIFCFITQEPTYLMSLMGARLIQFVVHTRPFYSSFHNGVSLLTLMPIYVLALAGLFLPGEKRQRRWLPALVCIFQALIIALTFADWDGRWLVAILPLVFLFAAGSIAWASNWIHQPVELRRWVSRRR